MGKNGGCGTSWLLGEVRAFHESQCSKEVHSGTSLLFLSCSPVGCSLMRRQTQCTASCTSVPSFVSPTPVQTPALSHPSQARKGSGGAHTHGRAKNEGADVHAS